MKGDEYNPLNNFVDFCAENHRKLFALSLGIKEV